VINMATVENLKKFYLYDRWFELEKMTDEELIYWSIPKDSSNRIRINIDLKSNEIILSYFKDKIISECRQTSSFLLEVFLCINF